MKKLTPVLLVDSIEPCLPFWTERLKFAKTVDVPGENGLEFCILQRGDVEVMLQTRAGVIKELPAMAGSDFGCDGVSLFIEVEQLDEFIDATEGCDVFMQARNTFYGMRELGVIAPGGCKVVFAQELDEGGQ